MFMKVHASGVQGENRRAGVVLRRKSKLKTVARNCVNDGK